MTTDNTSQPQNQTWDQWAQIWVKFIGTNFYEAYNFSVKNFPQASTAVAATVANYVCPASLTFASAAYTGIMGVLHKESIAVKANIAKADYEIIATNLVHLSPFVLSLIGGYTGFLLPAMITAGVEYADKYHDTQIVKTAKSFVTDNLKHLLGNEFTHSTEAYAAIFTGIAGYQLSSQISARTINALQNQVKTTSSELSKAQETLKQTQADCAETVDKAVKDALTAVNKAAVANVVNQHFTQPLSLIVKTTSNLLFDSATNFINSQLTNTGEAAQNEIITQTTKLLGDETPIIVPVN